MSRLFFKVLKDDDEAKKALDSWKTAPYTYDCYSIYNSCYDGDDSNGNIYFGFVAHPNVAKLVEEVNDNFKNIKIVIIGMKDVNYGGESYYGENPPDNYLLDFIMNYDKTYNYCLFKVMLSDKYIKESKFILSLTIAEFIRGYSPMYAHFKNMRCVENDFINSNLSAQNTSNYGAWMCCDPSGNYYCPREVFDKFDDVELINSITQNTVDFDYMPSIHRLVRVLDGSKPIDYIMEEVGDVYE